MIIYRLSNFLLLHVYISLGSPFLSTVEQKLGGVLLLRVEEEETADGKPTLIKKDFEFSLSPLIVSNFFSQLNEDALF